MKHRLSAVAAVGFAALLLPSHASAALGTACGNATFVPADGRLISATIPGSTTVFFALDNARSGSTYSMEVVEADAPFSPSLPAAVTYSDGFSTCAVALAGVRSTNTLEPTLTNSGRRISFTAASSFPGFSLANASATPINIMYSASNTTQYSPTWSTNGTYDTFYSLLNTGNATCNATLTLRNTAGGTVQTTALTINAGATAATNTVSLATPRNLSGTAKLTHDCPPGVILSNAAVANFSISPTPYFQFVPFQPMREIGR